MRALVTIRNTAIPEPSTYNATSATTVDSGRNTKGVFIGAIIRDDTAKIELTWKFITAENWSMIEKLFQPKFGGSFINPVTFFNPAINDWETRNMYVSARTNKMFLRRPDGSVRGYTDARIALIEV